MSIRHSNISNLPESYTCKHGDYEYCRKDFVPKGSSKQSIVCVYEIPPLKSSCPYHYHLRNEETFFIIRGEGLLKTPDGERTVRAGDMLFFPADPSGAHKITNSSPTEPLVYIDFDTMNELDAAVYPDSGKVGIKVEGANRFLRLEDAVDYYEGE